MERFAGVLAFLFLFLRLKRKAKPTRCEGHEFVFDTGEAENEADGYDLGGQVLLDENVIFAPPNVIHQATNGQPHSLRLRVRVS